MKELKEIDRWVELYETHDKYTFVGYLVDDPVVEILESVGFDGGETEEDTEVVAETLEETGSEMETEQIES